MPHISNPAVDAQKIVEGNWRAANYTDSLYNSINKGDISLPPVFQRWVVLETIFDPTIIDEIKIRQLESKFSGLINNKEKYALNVSLPRNSILAKPVINDRTGNTAIADLMMFLYPMFPPALSMPCKPGEHVWVMFESLNERQNLGYWVCSIVGPGHIDDVNHVHQPREFDKTFEALELFALPGDNKIQKPRYHFKNGVYQVLSSEFPDQNNQDPIVPASTAVIQGTEQEYENILKNSEGSILSTYESVPRFKKRPGDIVFEGSNNSLISIGRDRTGDLAQYSTDPATGETIIKKQVEYQVGNTQLKNAGSIDLVAGRGQQNKTSGRKVINHLQNEELAKDRVTATLNRNEGNPDFIHDRSRIYISQRTKLDLALTDIDFFTALSSENSQGVESLVQKNSAKGISDSLNGDAGIIIKSDKVRIFARSDVQILVTGFSNEDVSYGIGEHQQSTTMNNENQTIEINSIKTENRNAKKFASITIKSNGDIVFEPSDMGYIKLGGEDANKGIVCTSRPVITDNGGVAGKPLMTNGGALFAGSKTPSPTGNVPALLQSQTLDLGTFSNKVLIK